jgi:hypothetical protein
MIARGHSRLGQTTTSSHTRTRVKTGASPNWSRGFAKRVATMPEPILAVGWDVGGWAGAKHGLAAFLWDGGRPRLLAAPDAPVRLRAPLGALTWRQFLCLIRASPRLELYPSGSYWPSMRRSASLSGFSNSWTTGRAWHGVLLVSWRMSMLTEKPTVTLPNGSRRLCRRRSTSWETTRL